MSELDADEYPQLRDNMSTMTREIWTDAKTKVFSKTAESPVPHTMRPDYRLMMLFPFGVFAPPHALAFTYKVEP